MLWWYEVGFVYGVTRAWVYGGMVAWCFMLVVVWKLYDKFQMHYDAAAARDDY